MIFLDFFTRKLILSTTKAINKQTIHWKKYLESHNCQNWNFSLIKIICLYNYIFWILISRNKNNAITHLILLRKKKRKPCSILLQFCVSVCKQWFPYEYLSIAQYEFFSSCFILLDTLTTFKIGNSNNEACQDSIHYPK